jgi:succinate dehydrogenase / fumarate reductase, iron-sulfur subunit
MKLTLKIWRQLSTETPGKFETHEVTDAKPEMKLVELLDHLNDTLVAQGREPIAFESDCREGICGTCGITVDGRPHGPVPNTTIADSTYGTSKTVPRCAWNPSGPPPTRSCAT